jgi:outer membrane immunogenic protein
MTKILATGALMTGALLGALVAGSAMAADLKAPAPAPMMMKAPPMPVSTWTGCYVGAGGGYGMWDQDTFGESDPGHVGFTSTFTSGGRGWFGTAGAGCGYQVTSSIVIGAFGDWDFGDISGQYHPPSTAVVGTESEKWAWAAGGRIGYLVTPTFLTYFSGGYTQAHFDAINLNNTFTGVASGTNIVAHSYQGYFLGSGFDYAITFLPAGFFLRSEYRYATYTADDLSDVVSATGVTTGLAVNSKKYVQTVRSELTYRFNWFH